VKRLLEARQPGSKARALISAHSRMETLAKRPNDIHRQDNSGAFLVDLCLDRLNEFVVCMCDGMSDSSVAHHKRQYDSALSQLRAHIGEARNGAVLRQEPFSFLSGAYVSLANRLKKNALNYCEAAYLSFCTVLVLLFRVR